ncbi:LAETG motif-containing sortase-dependent surface protein [Streptomyces lycii]|uniref:LPXTG cell wall anchor domain-containing protein n=2 Tax=Streptomyces TaxID=1883 RepID=A0ABQ7FIQ4_9ACTN|nr:LAETG motif-containing sortase-dependent surface protein [Streptomyces lycii]KAF4407833.1 LPXTG cell wall anchor domain-containing protein [Streptomyces lycii]
MKIRRILATAVVAAVAAPAALLTTTPAFAADEKPAAEAQSKPSIAELEKAAAEAKKAYDKAVADEKAALAAVETEVSDTAPLAVAAKEALDKASTAATAKAVADRALTDARAALDALPDTATEAERTAAEQAVTDAEAAAGAAAEAKTAADTAAEQAVTARDDARVAALRALDQARKAVTKALAAMEAADQALADARADAGEDPGEGGGDCVPAALLSTLHGLPSKIAAGSTVDFTLRVTNDTGRTLDQVIPLVFVHATDKTGLKDTDHLLSLKWSDDSTKGWKDLGPNHRTGTINSLEQGEHGDIDLRLTIDAKAPVGNGAAFAVSDYVNDDGTCGGSPDLSMYEFEIGAPGSKPGPDAKPSDEPGTDRDVKAQGGADKAASDAAGSLAETGSSSAVPQLALAGGAAMLLGAGAVYVVRRRSADSRV